MIYRSISQQESFTSAWSRSKHTHTRATRCHLVSFTQYLQEESTIIWKHTHLGMHWNSRLMQLYFMGQKNFTMKQRIIRRCQFQILKWNQWYYTYKWQHIYTFNNDQFAAVYIIIYKVISKVQMTWRAIYIYIISTRLILCSWSIHTIN